MLITVNSVPTALQAIALLSAFATVYGLFSILRGGIVAEIDARDPDKARWYNDREPWVSRFVVYRGRALGVAIVIVSLIMIILCGLGIAPTHFPLRLEPTRAFWYVMLTAIVGAVPIIALWLFTNKMWIGESSE